MKLLEEDETMEESVYDGLNKRAQLSRVQIFKNWIKDKQQFVKEQPER